MHIEYNGIKYREHPKQPYFYCARKGKRYSRSLHRQMWYDVYGEIPAGHDIHHKDGNPYNNTIENFEVISRSDHQRIHAIQRVKENREWFIKFQKKGIELAKEWHASDAGIEWHRQHAKNFNFGNFEYGNGECANCGKHFVRKSWQNEFCSNNCKSISRRKSGVDNITQNCARCGTEFIKNKYARVKFCTRSCAAKQRISNRREKDRQKESI